MKSLTNLYVYDGKNVPHVMTDIEHPDQVETSNCYVKSNNIAPKAATAYVTGTDIYIKQLSNTEKPISIEENSVFYIIFNGNVVSNIVQYGKDYSGTFNIHGLSDEIESIPFGTRFNDNGIAFPMQITDGDVYLCCYVKNSWKQNVPASNRVLASKIGRADNGVVEFNALVTEQNHYSIETPYDGLYTIYIANVTIGSGVNKQCMFTVSCFNSFNDFPSSLSGPTIDGVTVQYFTSGSSETGHPEIMITGLPTGDNVKTHIKCYCKLY